MSRQQALEEELAHVSNLNTMVDSLLQSIRLTQANITKSKNAADNSSVLLEDWIKILNQTRFATAALQDPSWEGPNDTEDSQEQPLSQEAALEAELQRVERENHALQTKLNQLLSSERDAKRLRR